MLGSWGWDRARLEKGGTLFVLFCPAGMCRAQVLPLRVLPVGGSSALLAILGFPMSNTMLTHYLHNLTVTAEAPEVDTITPRLREPVLCQSQAAEVPGT